MTPAFEAPVTETHRYFLGQDEDGVAYFALQKDTLAPAAWTSRRARPGCARRACSCRRRRRRPAGARGGPWRTGSGCTASARAAASATVIAAPVTSAAASACGA
ncbi:hypothetical protein GCM10020221_26480 [Streptomyces thioluteus]|uniref:Uncharacterized protein n=1 Tax=Streptomyces thioluteus TaxID=66431 RepID=A0ABN3WVG1_STRTU